MNQSEAQETMEKSSSTTCPETYTHRALRGTLIQGKSLTVHLASGSNKPLLFLLLSLPSTSPPYLVTDVHTGWKTAQETICCEMPAHLLTPSLLVSSSVKKESLMLFIALDNSEGKNQRIVGSVRIPVISD